MTTAIAPPAVQAMAARLTRPFARGSDLMVLATSVGGSLDEVVVAPYDFTEHVAQFGTEPEPSYVVQATGSPASGTALVLTFTDPTFGGGTATVEVSIPDGTIPGDFLAVPTPAGATSGTRLTALREVVAGPAPDGAAATRWRVTTLLGTLARLTWLVGVERDRIRAEVGRIAAQREIGSAAGASLDLIGSDLAVPRFPPTPYSFDADTVALYHLDDDPGASPAVLDATGMFPGRTPHDGTLTGSGVAVGVPARYDAGIACSGPGSVTVPSSTDFDVAATGELTVECFVRPGAATGDGQVLGRRTPTGAGWSLEVGDLGTGVASTVRVTVSDGNQVVTARWVSSLSTTAFTHLAFVLDRRAALVRLFVNGAAVDAADASALGAVVSTADLLIGPDTTGFRGVVDEVRISSIARASFGPALGETDDHYRRRLALFRRWCLPTPGSLQDLLNELIPTIDGVDAPFVVDDTDSPMERGHHLIRVWPTVVPGGATIDRDGRSDTVETDLWPSDADSFDPDFLGTHDHSGITYAAAATGRVDPTRPPADPHRMQPAVAAALDRLADLLAGVGLAGLLTVISGYDPSATDSRSTGRAVLLSLPSTDPGALAAWAHRAGFDFVARQPGSTVYAACAPGLPALLGPEGSTPQVFSRQPTEVAAGSTVTLTTQLGTSTYTAAPVPLDAEARFWVTPSGGAAASVTPQAPASPTAALAAVAPGRILVSADITRGGRTQTLTAQLVLRPASLPDGASIAADGTLGVTADVVGTPEPGFDPAYLLTHDDPRVTYGPAPTDHQMQRGIAGNLDDLLDQLEGDGLTDPLSLLAAYDPTPGVPTLANRGRLLRLSHPALSTDELALLAHRVGFGYVENESTAVVVAAEASDPVGVYGPDEVSVGDQVTLEVDPLPATIGAATRLGWSSGLLTSAPGEVTSGVGLTTTTDPSVAVVGQLPGVSWVQATLRSAGDAGPYAFAVRLRPELAGARISLDDYYLLMNALNSLHPVGVEVLTESIRSAVVELDSSPDGLDPSFTYPAFRVHRTATGKRPGQRPATDKETSHDD